MSKLQINQEAADLLAEITSLDIEELTEENKAFLRARRDYLTKDQLKQYEDILNKKTKPLKTETVKEDNAKKSE